MYVTISLLKILYCVTFMVANGSIYVIKIKDICKSFDEFINASNVIHENIVFITLEFFIPCSVYITHEV